jgi:uncharacterized coiled-coil DUF342 family protein
MLLRRSHRRLVDVRSQQMLAYMIQHANALVEQRAELLREITTLRRERDEAYANFNEYRDAVQARRRAGEETVNYYRAQAELARMREAPPRWLH